MLAGDAFLLSSSSIFASSRAVDGLAVVVLGVLFVLFAVVVVGDGAPHRGGRVGPSVFLCRRCLQLGAIIMPDWNVNVWLVSVTPAMGGARNDHVVAECRSTLVGAKPRSVSQACTSVVVHLPGACWMYHVGCVASVIVVPPSIPRLDKVPGR